LGKLLSAGNHKLAPEILVWNLNRKETCPGQTEWCDKHCYEKKAYRYPAVKPARDDRLILSTKDIFEGALIGEITRKRTPILACRIHGGGDFYSQEYIEKWWRIAEHFPHITFKANTRSWMYNYRLKPTNVCLRYSIDETTDPRTIEIMRPQVDGFAYIEGCQPEGTFKCPQKCGWGPGRCNYCYTRTGDVYFPIH
jgi:hypothetical protein